MLIKLTNQRAIKNQKKAIKHCKKLKQLFEDKGMEDDAKYMVEVLVEQERVLIFLETQQEELKTGEY